MVPNVHRCVAGASSSIQPPRVSSRGSGVAPFSTTRANARKASLRP
jgi:hypothetical protein